MFVPVYLVPADGVASSMGSLRFGGIVFQVFSFDHSPPHVHARYIYGNPRWMAGLARRRRERLQKAS